MEVIGCSEFFCLSPGGVACLLGVGRLVGFAAQCAFPASRAWRRPAVLAFLSASLYLAARNLSASRVSPGSPSGRRRRLATAAPAPAPTALPCRLPRRPRKKNAWGPSHMLVAYKGAMRRRAQHHPHQGRSRKSAEEALKKARAGEDFACSRPKSIPTTRARGQEGAIWVVHPQR